MFVGLVPLVREYMEHNQYSQYNKDQINKYLEFILLRSKGKIPTGAKLLRHIALHHSDYKQDSIITEVYFNLIFLIENEL